MRESKGLMGLPAPSMGYDGVVIDDKGHRIAIHDGVLSLGGKQFHVTEDGKVMGPDDKPVALIQNGKLAPLQQQGAQPSG